MPWKRRRLKMEWSCGLPGCTHRFWFLAWLHAFPGWRRGGVTRELEPPVRDIDPPKDIMLTRSEVDEFARRVTGQKERGVNIVASLQMEISRVERLLEVFDSITRGEAQTAIRFGRQSLAQNSLEGMYEALADLRDFTAEPKR